MSEPSREQIEGHKEWLKESPSAVANRFEISLCNMALRALDAEERAERVEAEAARAQKAQRVADEVAFTRETVMAIQGDGPDNTGRFEFDAICNIAVRAIRSVNERSALHPTDTHVSPARGDGALDSEGRCRRCGGTRRIGAGESKTPCPDCATDPAPEDDAIGYEEVVQWAEEVCDTPRNHDDTTPERERALAQAIMSHLHTRDMPDPAPATHCPTCDDERGVTYEGPNGEQDWRACPDCATDPAPASEEPCPACSGDLDAEHTCPPLNLSNTDPAPADQGNDMETLTCACGRPSVHESGECALCSTTVPETNEELAKQLQQEWNYLANAHTPEEYMASKDKLDYVFIPEAVSRLSAPAPADRPERSGEDAREDAWLIDRGRIPKWASSYYKDRPEPSEALEIRWIPPWGHWHVQLGGKHEGFRDKPEEMLMFAAQLLDIPTGQIRQALSQPVPAVPDAVRRLPDKWRTKHMVNADKGRGLQLAAEELDAAIAAAPTPAGEQ